MAQYKTKEREDLKKIFIWSPKLSESEINNLYSYLKTDHDIHWINGSTVTIQEGNTVTVTDTVHTITIELIGDNSMAVFTIDGIRIFNFLVFKTSNSFEIYSPLTKSTMFGLWTRRRDEIDSSQLFGATNLDYIWVKMKSWKPMIIEQYMLIEEKTGVNFTEKHQISGFQDHMFEYFDTLLSKDPLYKGFHMIQFQNTNPENGNIYIDGGLVHKSTLFRFLRFELPQDQYKSSFKKKFSMDRTMEWDYDLKHPYDIWV